MSPEGVSQMRARGVVAAVMAVPAALAIAVAVHHPGPGPQVPHRPAVVQTVTSAQPGPASSAAAGKSHTVAKALAGHALYHLVPHPYIFHRPYVFRILRRRY